MGKLWENCNHWSWIHPNESALKTLCLLNIKWPNQWTIFGMIFETKVWQDVFDLYCSIRQHSSYICNID